VNGVRADVVERQDPSLTNVVLEAEVPLLRVGILEVVIAKVKLVNSKKLIQVIALSRKNGDIARRQYGTYRKRDCREGCRKSQAARNCGISEAPCGPPSAALA
jgi:hypothetical protein